MNTFFLVWYVLSWVTLENGKMVSGLSIERDLDSCVHSGARAVAADSNVHWRCHEMTTEAKEGKLLVQFPSN